MNNKAAVWFLFVVHTAGTVAVAEEEHEFVEGVKFAEEEVL